MINKKTIYFSGIIFGLLIAVFGFSHQVLAADFMCCVGKDTAGIVKECMLYVENPQAVWEKCPPQDIQCLEYAGGKVSYGEKLEGECIKSIPIINSKESCLSYSKCLSNVLSPLPILNLSEDYQKDIIFGESVTVDLTANLLNGSTNANLKDLLVSFNCDLCTGSGAKLSGGTVPLSGGQTNLTFILDTSKLYQEYQNKMPLPGEWIIKINALINGVFLNSNNLKFNIKQFDCSQYQPPCSQNYNQCFPFEGKCVSRLDTNLCSQLTKYPQLCGTQADGTAPGTKGEVCFWNKQQNQCQTALGAAISKEYAPPPDYYTKGSGILPPCAFDGSCRSVNRLLETAIRFGKSFFAIIGSFAFVFFIYGGITMILSFGNAEKTKKGRDILVAAVIGLIIVFSAYLLIDFVLDAIGVESSFRGI